MNFFKLFKRNLIYSFKTKINIDKDEFQTNTDLEKLFSFYKTDKANYLNDNNEQGHGYSEFYQKHLNDFKEKKINILEIGSYSGASAAAFAKYFNNVNIYCLDINLKNFKFKSKYIHPFGINANNKNSVNKFFNKIDFFKSIKKFDIIIDDGSHLLSDQLKSLNFFFKYVKLNGYYIIEEYRFPEYFSHLKDVNHSTVSEVLENLRNKKIIKNDFLDNFTIENLSKNISYIFEYKGKTVYSDILFIKKSN